MGTITNLTNNLEYLEVWFALQFVNGESFLTHKAVRDLIYHNRPPLPLSEEDKTRKLIFPSRTNYMKSYLQEKSRVSQYLA